MRQSFAALATAGLLVVVGCSDAGSSSQVPSVASSGSAAAGSDGIRIIEASTQMHLDGVGVGVGNIWVAEYTPAGGTLTTGLTAALFISIEADASKNRTERVGAGQDVGLPGYHLHIVAVEPTRIQVEVTREPD
jgi:hypothetical protein